VEWRYSHFEIRLCKKMHEAIETAKAIPQGRGTPQSPGSFWDIAGMVVNEVIELCGSWLSKMMLPWVCFCKKD
jgi:hypothetical protein